jgi:hypothetical protein
MAGMGTLRALTSVSSSDTKFSRNLAAHFNHSRDLLDVGLSEFLVLRMCDRVPTNYTSLNTIIQLTIDMQLFKE